MSRRYHIHREIPPWISLPLLAAFAGWCTYGAVTAQPVQTVLGGLCSFLWLALVLYQEALARIT